MLFQLDAEGVDFYGDQEDIIPAINAAMRWIVSVINSALGQKRLGEEIFKDMHRALVFRTSRNSRVSVGVFPGQVWTITAIAPLPVTGTTGQPVPAMPNEDQSYLRPDLYHKDSRYSSKRVPIEEWNRVSQNPFAAGFDNECEDLREYAYLNPITYDPDGGLTIEHEIEIKPFIDKGLVTIFFIERPVEIDTLGDDDIPLPSQVFNMLTNKALQYISYQQGDRTNLFMVTQSDITTLVNSVQ
jgi:hypothetical protein